MDRIKGLIKKGEELRGTFTVEGFGSKITNDREGVSKWLTQCLLEMRPDFPPDDPLYKKFEQWISNQGNLSLTDFNELIGVLKAIVESSINDDDD
ncbi:MAG: hypothetical protein ACOYJ1_15615, partial [Peptococcales bacterium]